MNRISIEKWTVPVAAAEAAITGIVLIVSPPLFARLIMGVELGSAAEVLGRLAGIAMLGTGLAAWSSPQEQSHPRSSVRALLVYNLLATIYLGYLGLGGRLTGVLLWPAIALHAIFAVLLASGYLSAKSSAEAHV
jgi:hypothetical protein